MRPIDAKPLGEALAALAEVFGARALSPKAVAVWADALRDFPIERVEALLRAWPRTHAKMPAPADAWKVLNDERTDDIERTAAEQKQQERREVARMFDPRVKDANMAKIRALIVEARGKGMPTGPQLAHAILDEVAAGRRPLGAFRRTFVMHNLGWTKEQIDAVEEQGARANRAAA